MRYCCVSCETEQWRGLFPEQMFHWRYAVFHGIALGACAIITKLLFAKFGYTTNGWVNGPVSLALCVVLLATCYMTALVAEAIWVCGRRCRECGERSLRPAW